MTIRELVRYGLYMMAALLFCVTPVYAETLQSSSYRFEESAIGTGSLIESSSTNFQARSATGDIAIGNSASANFQVDSGTHTSPDPALTFTITNADVDFGSFSSAATTTASATFNVINYTTWGYVVQIIGTTPANGSHVIPGMGTTAIAQPGVEQFGVNLVANTSPSSFGANPDNGQFGHGLAATNYDTPNEFRFVSGETIATAPQNSGQTDYTMSYIINVGTLTPGGIYTAAQTLIVVGTY